MTFKPVDTAIIMVVGPIINDSDFKSLEEAIAYNAAGMDVSLIVEKTDGTTSVTAITLTTGGTSDWTHKDGGYYEIEITAAQNVEEGISYVRGICDGVLPFESPRYSIVKANIYDSLIKGTDVLQTDVTQLAGVTQSLTDLKDFADDGYDPLTHKVQGVILTDTVTALTGHTAQTGDNFTRLGAPAGASIAADLVVIDNFVDDLETRLSAIRAGYLDNLSVGAVALASGVDITHIHGTALTETIDGYLAAAFVKLFDVAVPLLVASDTMRGTENAALAAALADVQADLDNPAQYMADISTLVTSTALVTHDNKLDTVDTNIDAILEDTGITLETHLTDIKGTGFTKDIDSLPQCLTAVGFSTHDVDAIQTALEADDGKLYAVYAALLNKMTVTSTLMRIYKDDAITLLNELTLSDDDTTVTRV